MELPRLPDISITHGLNVPPFGVGFDRSVKRTRSSAPRATWTPFASFDYRSDAWRGTVAVVRRSPPDAARGN